MHQVNRASPIAGSVRLRTSLLVGLALACGACSGSPTEPGGRPVVSGVYAGSVIHQTATPPEHCYTQWLEIQGGSHFFPITVEVSIDGNRLSGLVSSEHLPTVCTIEGSFTPEGDGEWHQTSCSEACFVLPDDPPSCGPMRLCSRDHRFSGRLTRDAMIGDFELRWEATQADTGAALGTVTISGPLEATR